MARMQSAVEFEQKVLAVLGMEEEKRILRMEIIFSPDSVAKIFITRFMYEEETNNFIEVLAEYEWAKVKETEVKRISAQPVNEEAL